MYAVIRTGGKQYRVEEGQTLEVELVGEVGASVDLAPVMLVDEGDVLATPDQLSNASVTAEVTGTVRSKKIKGFTYKNKSNQSRRWGHRQNYNTITITGISKG
ncbi:MAG: 50S ribosomal protein L21 [Acidimicrobiales bacterium]